MSPAMNTLSEFLEREGLTGREFAAKVGCAESYVTMVRGGRRRFGLEMAIQIEQRTGGKLRAVDLRPDLAHLLKRPDAESA